MTSIQTKFINIKKYPGLNPAYDGKKDDVSSADLADYATNFVMKEPDKLKALLSEINKIRGDYSGNSICWEIGAYLDKKTEVAKKVKGLCEQLVAEAMAEKPETPDKPERSASTVDQIVNKFIPSDELKKRYPGVTFIGIKNIFIQNGVKIARGTVINATIPPVRNEDDNVRVRTTLTINGKTYKCNGNLSFKNNDVMCNGNPIEKGPKKSPAESKLQDGTIIITGTDTVINKNSKIRGSVIIQSGILKKGAFVSGQNIVINKSVISAGTKITGSNHKLYNTSLDENAKIDGNNNSFRDSTIGKRSSVIGNNIIMSNCEILPDGEFIGDDLKCDF